MTPGFHDITEKEYHADPCDGPSMSSSIAKTIVSRSPLHAWSSHPKLGGKQSSGTEEMAFGELAHKILLGKGKEISVCEFETWRGKEASQFWDDAIEADSIPCLRKNYFRATSLAAAVICRMGEMGFDYVFQPDDSKSEVCAVWQEGDTWGRALIDRLIIDEDAGTCEIWDLKTMTQSAHPRACIARIAGMGYDLQQEWYKHGVSVLRPDLAGRIKFRFVFAETSPPFAITPVELNGEWSVIGELKWQRALETWKRCLATNKWPSYTDGIQRVEPPPWALKDEITAETLEQQNNN